MVLPVTEDENINGTNHFSPTPDQTRFPLACESKKKKTFSFGEKKGSGRQAAAAAKARTAPTTHHAMLLLVLVVVRRSRPAHGKTPPVGGGFLLTHSLRCRAHAAAAADALIHLRRCLPACHRDMPIETCCSERYRGSSSSFSFSSCGCGCGRRWLL